LTDFIGFENSDEIIMAAIAYLRSELEEIKDAYF